MATDLDASTGGVAVTSGSALVDGLNPLHVAVLNGDFTKIHELLADGEVGVDSRTAIGSTTLMLAALYGHYRMFKYLWKKGARFDKKDNQGYNALNYIKSSTFTEELCRKYKNIATKGPDLRGKRQIYNKLKVLMRDGDRAYAQGLAEARSQLEAGQLSDQPVDQPLNHASGQPSLASRTVFIRSLCGKTLEFVEVKPLAITEVNYSLKRKSTAIVRGINEDGTHTIAVSGWSGIHGQNVLDNNCYTSLVRQTCAIYGFKLVGNWLDCRFPGEPAEKKGAFVSCHAEKQLGVYVLLKALSYILNTKAITVSNIAELSKQLEKLPARITRTTIELDHKPCKSCLDFLKLLRLKAGLIITCQPQEWYIQGYRDQVLYRADGSSLKPVGAGGDDADVVEDEIDEYNNNGTVEMEPQSEAAAHEPSVETAAVQDAAVSQLWTPTRRMGREKKGSPVDELPDQPDIRYAKFNVTPPSQKVQALPTPRSREQSHDHFVVEIPQVPVSPSPVGVFSAFGSEDHMDRTPSQEYELEEILDSKEEDGRLYLVKWKGYPHEDNTWETEANLVNASGAISKFWKRFIWLSEPKPRVESSEA